MLIIITVLVVGIFLGSKAKSTNHRLPETIKKQINFVVFMPPENSKSYSMKFDQPTSVFSYKTYVGGKSITISEQSTPQNFTDIPQAYDKLTESLNSYSTFDSFWGKVDLTHPKELNGGQAAVMNAKGTLLFAKPTQDISNNNWRTFFNSLEVVK